MRTAMLSLHAWGKRWPNPRMYIPLPAQHTALFVYQGMHTVMLSLRACRKRWPKPRIYIPLSAQLTALSFDGHASQPCMLHACYWMARSCTGMHTTKLSLPVCGKRWPNSYMYIPLSAQHTALLLEWGFLRAMHALCMLLRSTNPQSLLAHGLRFLVWNGCKNLVCGTNDCLAILCNRLRLMAVPILQSHIRAYIEAHILRRYANILFERPNEACCLTYVLPPTCDCPLVDACTYPEPRRV